MKNFIILICCLLFVDFVAFSQDRNVSGNDQSYIVHTVDKGETIFSLSKKYGVDQKELVNANPNLIFGLKTGQELKIPVHQNRAAMPIPKVQSDEVQPVKTFYSYRVRKKNTLHFISKKYGISIADIEKYNPEVKKGLKKGMVLKIPDAAELKAFKEQQAIVVERAQQKMMHKVVGDETLYSISKKYDRSISSILMLNPELNKGLKIGMEIEIPKEKAEETISSVNKDGFFIHLIESGETFWRLERRYGITRDELIEYNPVLSQGLMAGVRIRIPARNIPEVKVPVDENRFEKHLVRSGETLYGLAINYKTRVSELRKANPVLELRGLIAGETIFVPRSQESVADKTNTVEKPFTKQTEASYREEVRMAQPTIDPTLVAGCERDSMAAYDHYDVGLLLPFYLEANDTVNHIRLTPEEIENDTILKAQFEAILEAGRDTFKVRDEKIIYPRSENFLQFYEGVLLAVDSLQKVGMDVVLHVFDTNQDQQVIDSLMHLDVFRELDLIIGPIFPNLQNRVAEFAFKNRIPMVSPLSSGGDYELNNPYYFKVNPNKEFLVRKTARYITDEYFDKNIIVLRVGEYKHLPEATLVDLCREKFFATGFNSQTGDVLFHEYDFQKEGYWGLSRIVSKTRENVFIIPSENEGQVSVGVTNLNTLSEEYPVTLVGMSNFQRYQSIQPEYFHHMNLHLLSPYFVDYESTVTNRFIDGFRSNFYAEPSQFSFQGYDVAFYFISALHRYGKDFARCLSSHQVSLTQGAFNFEKQSRFGGYMNQGLLVVSYQPNYSIVKEGTLVNPGFSLAGE